MSYINPIYITEKLAKDALTRDGLVGQLALTDLAINRLIQSKGVPSGSLPLDDDGYATSVDVIEYGLAHLYGQVYFDKWGAGNGEEDIYLDKFREATYMERKMKNRATYDTIMSNTNDTRSSYFKDVPVM